VHYWREEPLEVDAVIEGSWGRWAIEVKTGSLEPARLRGLAEFSRRFAGFTPLVLCDPGQEGAAERLGLRAQAWTTFLLDGPPSAR
jgi:predicted RecB family endonuclease